jgi:hypothetical protein
MRPCAIDRLSDAQISAGSGYMQLVSHLGEAYFYLSESLDHT